MDRKRDHIVLLLGGNYENSKQLITLAVERLQHHAGDIIALSSFYESEPWGFSDERWFINQVAVLRTHFTARGLLRYTQKLERELGRKQKTREGYEARPIDIDLLFAESRVIQLPGLIVPHPRLHLRRFTLEPLCELMPGFIHPVLKKSLATLLQQCPDKGKVHRIRV